MAVYCATIPSSRLCSHDRIGGASALFAVGCSPENIKAMGRWWSGAYLLYIRQLQGSSTSASSAARRALAARDFFARRLPA